MDAKKNLAMLLPVGFLFSWIAFTGCATPPDPEAQKGIQEKLRREQEERRIMGW